MTVRKVLRWIVTILVTGAGAFLVVLLLGGYLLQHIGCAIQQTEPIPRKCVLLVQLLPLGFLILWAALGIYFIRAFK